MNGACYLHRCVTSELRPLPAIPGMLSQRRCTGLRGWDFGYRNLPRPFQRPKPGPRCPETPFLVLACSGLHARADRGTLGRPPGRQACMACTGTDHMFGHAVLRTHAHAHAHTRLHAVVSKIHALWAQRLASGCRYGDQAARRRLVENVECAASESRLSTLRGSTHAIAQKPHAKWKTCHAHSCA